MKFLVLLLIALFLVWRTYLYFQVNRQLAAIRGAGLPTSGAELNRWVGEIPDIENGALALTDAFTLFRTFPDGRSNQVNDPKFLSRTNEWSAQDLQLIDEFVQTNSPALGIAREAFRFRRFHYPADFSYGPETQLPHLSRLKRLGQIVALQTALEAEQGRTNEWSGEAALQLHLASTLDEEPIIISQLVRSALVNICIQVTERALNRTGLSEEAAIKLQQRLEGALKTNSLPNAFVGERAMTIPIFRLSRKEAQSFNESEDNADTPRKPQKYSGKPFPALWLTGFFERDLNFFLETMDKAISLAKLPAPASLILTNHFQDAGATAYRRHFLYSAILLPSFSRVIVRDVTTQARITTAIAALAVERFRNARGRLPEDLGEVVPEFLERVPPDPFDGGQLRYRRLTRGYVLYSVGPDGRDDGGREPPEWRKSSDKTSYDITFIVER